MFDHWTNEELVELIMEPQALVFAEEELAVLIELAGRDISASLLSRIRNKISCSRLEYDIRESLFVNGDWAAVHSVRALIRNEN